MLGLSSRKALPLAFTLVSNYILSAQSLAIPRRSSSSLLDVDVSSGFGWQWGNVSSLLDLSPAALAVNDTLPSPESSVSATTASSATSQSASLLSSPSSTPGSPPSSAAPERDSLVDSTQTDIDTIRRRRIATIAEDVIDPLVGTVADISEWVETLGQDGKWPDSEVDYTTGCDGQKANWPARLHWQRIAFMAAAWHGGVEGADEFANDRSVLDAVSRAMDFWFQQDFTDPSCLSGDCKCGTPGFWNTNWFSNVITIPLLVGESCLLVGPDNLSDSQRKSCTQFSERTAGTLINGVDRIGKMTGANALDVSKITIDGGLLNNNASAIALGYQHIHDEVVVHSEVKADGVKADGSFSQHAGLLYNGNYGKDYVNDILAMEICAGGTQFSATTANPDSQKTFESLIDADLWMIYRNVKTDVLHFDFSTLNRFISFPTADDQATGKVQINISRIQKLGDEWNSDALKSVSQSLLDPSNSANSGNVIGNRMFYANDYMVQRGSGYVTTLKMYSSRTSNSECTNEQNPFGFHLSDGTVYTYLDGSQYEDIAGGWDWNLIPGTTVDYGATKLSCDLSRLSTKEDFVGGASDGKLGAAVMRYKNPVTGSLSFQKAWFFLDNDVQHVMLSQVQSSSSSSSSNPGVISVLDQKKLNGPVLVNGRELDQGGNFSDASSLWHDGVGYTFDRLALNVDFGSRHSDWQPLGISKLAKSTVDIFSAWISHGSGKDNDFSVPAEYTVFPAVSADEFEQKSQATKLTTVQNDENVSAVYDEVHHTAMFVFWQEKGGQSMYIPTGEDGFVVLKASANCVVIYKLDDHTVTVSDPTHKLSSVMLTLMRGVMNYHTFEVKLPTGGEAGNSVTQKIP